MHGALLLQARDDARHVLEEDPGSLPRLTQGSPGRCRSPGARLPDSTRRWREAEVRITGGLYRGRTILCPPGEIRPSMDRMRTSLFSILGNLSGTSFLDLFSGTGILGIEAASRGADPVLLVEKDGRKRATIQKNISFVETHIDLVVAPVDRFLRSNLRSWDIVFLDPPFAAEGKGAILDAACKRPHLAEGGLAIMHLHTAEKMSTERPGLELVRPREYGQSLLLFFRRAGEEEALLDDAKGIL